MNPKQINIMKAKYRGLTYALEDAYKAGGKLFESEKARLMPEMKQLAEQIDAELGKHASPRTKIATMVKAGTLIVDNNEKPDRYKVEQANKRIAELEAEIVCYRLGVGRKDFSK